MMNAGVLITIVIVVCCVIVLAICLFYKYFSEKKNKNERVKGGGFTLDFLEELMNTWDENETQEKVYQYSLADEDNIKQMLLVNDGENINIEPNIITFIENNYNQPKFVNVIKFILKLLNKINIDGKTEFISGLFDFLITYYVENDIILLYNTIDIFNKYIHYYIIDKFTEIIETYDESIDINDINHYNLLCLYLQIVDIRNETTNDLINNIIDAIIKHMDNILKDNNTIQTLLNTLNYSDIINIGYFNDVDSFTNYICTMNSEAINNQYAFLSTLDNYIKYKINDDETEEETEDNKIKIFEITNINELLQYIIINCEEAIIVLKSLCLYINITNDNNLTTEILTKILSVLSDDILKAFYTYDLLFSLLLFIYNENNTIDNNISLIIINFIMSYDIDITDIQQYMSIIIEYHTNHDEDMTEYINKCFDILTQIIEHHNIDIMLTNINMFLDNILPYEQYIQTFIDKINICKEICQNIINDKSIDNIDYKTLSNIIIEKIELSIS